MRSAADFRSSPKPPAALRLILAAPPAHEPDVLLSTLGNLRDVEPIGRASSESEVLKLYFSLAPDLVIVDLRLATDEPARLVGLLQRVAPGARVLALVPDHASTAGRAVRVFGATTVVSMAELLEQVERLGREHARARHGAGTVSARGRDAPRSSQQDEADQNHRDAQPLGGGQSE